MAVSLGTIPEYPAKTGSMPHSRYRSTMRCSSSAVCSYHEGRLGPPHPSRLFMSHHAWCAGPAIKRSICAALNPNSIRVLRHTVALPVSESGRLTPCNAIQSISCSHRFQSQKAVE